MDVAILEQKLGNKGRSMKIDDKIGLTVVDERINKLLERLEIDVYIDHVFSGTPSRKTLRKIISEIYGVPEDLVVVKNIFSEYGVGASKAHVHVYADADQMRKIEHKHILKRNGIAE